MTERIWTISNLISILRIVLSIPIAILLLQNDLQDRFLIIGLMVVAALTDLHDGMIARKLDQVTEFGKIIDPVADKVAIAVVSIILTVQGKIPIWFFTMIILRDLLILTGGIIIKKKKNITLQSNQVGKWAVFIVALFIILCVLEVTELAWLNHALLVLATIMLVLSLMFYTKRFFDVLRGTR